VVAVSSGDELLEKVSEAQPAVIICDIMMPGRDGYDVCQVIKSSPDTLHIPVILLSGTFEPLDRDRALAVGCSEILTKPFEARKLIDTVDRLVQGWEAARLVAPTEARRGDADTGPVALGTPGRLVRAPAAEAARRSGHAAGRRPRGCDPGARGGPGVHAVRLRRDGGRSAGTVRRCGRGAAGGP